MSDRAQDATSPVDLTPYQQNVLDRAKRRYLVAKTRYQETERALRSLCEALTDGQAYVLEVGQLNESAELLLKKTQSNPG